MNELTNLKETFEQLQLAASVAEISAIRQKAFAAFTRLGIPGARNEEWKYTRMGGLFAKPLRFANSTDFQLAAADLETFRLPGSGQANELFFINGIFSPTLSHTRSANLQVCSLEDAAVNEYKNLFNRHFNHSSQYLKDGINALNTAMLQGGVFIYIGKNNVAEHPVYIYNISDSRHSAVLSQPRSLVYLDRNSQLEVVETYHTIGASDSMTNEVMEIVVEKDANLSYYKIQDDAATASQVSTTHIRQVGTSVVNSVCITLGGAIVRNNLHAILETPHCEAHLYGLYFPAGDSHVDNHTVVDNVAPNCLSNELYKGIMDGNSTGVFNGKIFVRRDAQKTNAFQSNKNVLLSDTASINSKPQLEIDADDVKCSHGCTVGSLDQEGLFYLQSRGIPFKSAMALLLQGFAMDILEKIKPAPLRAWVEERISKRLGSGE